MSARIKNILAVIVGIVVGGVVNMSLIMMSSKIIPLPVGADFTTEAGLKASMHLMEPKHFIIPFFAHALHAFIGSMIACKMAANNQMRIALIIGLITFLGAKLVMKK